MRYLGIDYGSKRTGVALSDERGLLAFPNQVLITDKELVKKIAEICAREKVGAIVLGQSLDYKGVPNPIQKQISDFELRISDLTKLPVHYQPEFLTSAQAARNTAKDLLDAAAAALILQGYLDRRNVI